MAEKTIASIDGFVLLIDKGPDDGKSEIVLMKDDQTLKRTADLPELIRWSEPYHPFPDDARKGRYTNINLKFERALNPDEVKYLHALFHGVIGIGVSVVAQDEYMLHICNPEQIKIGIKTE